jgi:exodeoxyribonuclease VII small subunit
MTYEESVQRLQAIVAELEGDRVPLAQALTLFEEGITRLREAATTLQDADARVRTLVQQLDGSFELLEARG